MIIDKCANNAQLFQRLSAVLAAALESHGPVTKENLPVVARRIGRDLAPGHLWPELVEPIGDLPMPSACWDEFDGFHILTGATKDSVLTLTWSEACNDWVTDEIKIGCFEPFVVPFGAFETNKWKSEVAGKESMLGKYDRLPLGCRGLPDPYRNLLKREKAAV